jgi:hypothetical protein
MLRTAPTTGMRCYPDDWDEMLPLAEFAYNSSVHRSTKMTPFRLDLGWDPEIPLSALATAARPRSGAKPSASTLKGQEFADRLERLLGTAHDALLDAQDGQVAEANRQRQPVDKRIKVGASAFLDAKNLPITYANVRPNRRKLIHRYLGPYKIVRMVNSNAVELDLPNDMKIHDVVNVSRLKVDRTDNSNERIYVTPLPPVRTSRSGTTHIIEAIVGHRPDEDKRAGWKYHVKWEGWDSKDNTWEPEANLSGAKAMVEKY